MLLIILSPDLLNPVSFSSFLSYSDLSLTTHCRYRGLLLHAHSR